MNKEKRVEMLHFILLLLLHLLESNVMSVFGILSNRTQKKRAKRKTFTGATCQKCYDIGNCKSMLEEYQQNEKERNDTSKYVRLVCRKVRWATLDAIVIMTINRVLCTENCSASINMHDCIFVCVLCNAECIRALFLFSFWKKKTFSLWSTLLYILQGHSKWNRTKNHQIRIHTHVRRWNKWSRCDCGRAVW